jgi:hypothetical protein
MYHILDKYEIPLYRNPYLSRKIDDLLIQTQLIRYCRRVKALVGLWQDENRRHIFTHTVGFFPIIPWGKAKRQSNVKIQYPSPEKIKKVKRP